MKKEGDLSGESFPRTWYLVGIVPVHTIKYIYSLLLCQVSWEILCEFHRYQYISLSHTVHNQGICKVGRGIVCRIVPQVSKLVPLENDNFSPHQAPGIISRAYH